MKEIDTKILTKKEEMKLIEKRIRNKSLILMQKEISYKLLYRATWDGREALVFHNSCNDIKGTLTIIKTKKGIKFGGYTEETWNDNNSNNNNLKIGIGMLKSNNPNYKDDKNSFSFSIDLNKIYNNTNNGIKAISFRSNEGPSFGDLFWIKNNAFVNGGEFGDPNTLDCEISYNHPNFEMSNGDQYFEISEIEVFQVLFN